MVCYGSAIFKTIESYEKYTYNIFKSCETNISGQHTEWSLPYEEMVSENCRI